MRLRVLLLALFALLACGRDPHSGADATRRLEHLAIREAPRGDPAAKDALAVDVRARLALADEALAPVFVGVERDPSASDVLRLRATDEEFPRNRFRGVLFPGLDWDAATIDSLRLVASAERGGELRVRWAERAPQAGANFAPKSIATFEPLPPGQRLATESKVRAWRAWTGRVGCLGIECRPERGVIELYELDALARALEPGQDPGGAPGEPTDLGLVTRVIRSSDPLLELHDSQRAFPARAGRDGFALVRPGGDARLHVSASLPDGWSEADGPVTFAIHWAAAPDGDPDPPQELLAERTLDAASASTRWVPLVVDLPGSPEASQALWFTTRGGAAGRWNGLWGAPQLERTEVPRPPSALLITADTLRADHVGAYRDAFDLAPLPGLRTPHLDALAERGALLLDALSVVNATSPSHVSIFTGLPPRDHGVVDNRHRLAGGHHTLSEHLAEAGFHVIHASAAGHLNSDASGLGQGVDRYLEEPPGASISVPYTQGGSFEGLPEAAQNALLQQGVEYGVPRALRALEDAGARPSFLWLHLFDPHTPYLPRRSLLEALAVSDGPQGPDATTLLERLTAEAIGRPSATPDAVAAWTMSNPHLTFLGDVRTLEYAKALYAASVTQLDAGMGELFRGLEQLGREDTLIAFTSDHGEALGERGIWFNHTGVYQNTLHVPLIFSGPGVPGGRVLDAPVSTLDIAATIAELVGAPRFETPSGRSLVALLGGRSFDREQRWFEHTRDRQVGFRTANEHVVLSMETFRMGELGERYEANRLEALTPLAIADRLEASLPESAVRGDAWRREIETWLADKRHALSAEQLQLDAAAEAALEALGYKE